MNKEEILKFISGLFDRTSEATKFFHNDGRPATDIEVDREFLIHENEVKEGFNSVVEITQRSKKQIGEKELTSAEAIQFVNNPETLVPAERDAYNLTAAERRWVLEYIFCVEGGYFNHPNDPGGETMYGIIKREARENGYNGPMKDLPKEVATEIYLRKYWRNQKLEEINDFAKALCIFDFIVNSGNRGVKVAQRVVNKVYTTKNKLASTKEKYANLKVLSVDGVLGPKTIEAINMIDTDVFLMNYLYLQEDTYEDLMRANSKLRSFDEGWENRISTKVLYLKEIMDENREKESSKHSVFKNNN